jgi:hypothetical protein
MKKKNEEKEKEECMHVFKTVYLKKRNKAPLIFV